VLDAAEGQRPLTAEIRAAEDAVSIQLPRRVGQRVAEKIARDVRHVLRLDDVMGEFYAAVLRDEDFAWIAREGAGRLLRSPTVFEDLVKTICTTNCSWALTIKMVTGLVRNLGREAADGRRAFPTPAAMASAPPSFYTEEVRAGYRAPYLLELAQRVASGALDPEAWIGSELTADELRREMKRVKGVGDYAAENMLKLLGRYDCLALDSWVRANFARKHNRGRAASDARIARFYSRFKEWRGLALWCDMTRDWLEPETRA
jgi:N-glycosylase/DNA lyase